MRDPLLGFGLLVLLTGAGCPGAGAAYRPPEERSAALCPEDMDYVPPGSFLAGATAEEVDLPDYVPDIPRDPRPRGQFETGPYCIDRYEFPGEGRLPLAYVTWLQARVACELQGKRLCSEDEWTRACGGPLGDLYPYGPSRVPGLCNADIELEGSYDEVTPGGSKPWCRGPYGTFDLEGNVSEWVEDGPTRTAADRWVLGGTMWPGAYGRSCQARHGHPQVAPVAGDDGFRCCAEPRG